MTELPKLNIICPNCGSPNYTVDCSSVSKEYKIKCINCGKYYKDYDEVIKKHAENLNRKHPGPYEQSLILSSRKVFETDESQSAKSDVGKPKLSLVPRRIIFDIAKIREYGNNKYPEGGIDNWRQVEPERYRDAAFRHFLAYLDDPYGVDGESGLPHLWHLACNVAFLCDLEDTRMKLTKSESNYIHHDEKAVLGKVTDHNKDSSIDIKLTEDGKATFRAWQKKLIDEGFYDD